MLIINLVKKRFEYITSAGIHLCITEEMLIITNTNGDHSDVFHRLYEQYDTGIGPEKKTPYVQ